MTRTDYDFTDDTAAPNLPENGRCDPHQLYIEHTRGLWVRKNRKEDAIEIWLDGEELLAWHGADKIDIRLQTMFREVYRRGVADGVKANQAALRDALGLVTHG